MNRGAEQAAVAEPEREMIRRALPFAPPAGLAAFVLGAALGGWGAGWSAALGVAVVALNLAIQGLSMSRAARVSLTALTAVALGGFVLRLALAVAIMALLKHLAWFSILAFGLALVPATVILLMYEMRLLAAGLGSGLQIPGPAIKRRLGP